MSKPINLEHGSKNTATEIFLDKKEEKSNWLSIGLMIFSGVLLTFSMIFVREAQLLQPIPVSELNLARGLIGAFLMIAIWSIPKFRKKPTDHRFKWDSKISPSVYVIVIMICAGFTNYLYIDMLRYLNLVSAVAISFVVPLATSILAFLLYKERLGMRRLMAIAIGITGTSLILGPNHLNIFGLFIAILYICFASFGRVNTKVLSHIMNPITITLFGTLGILSVSLIMTLFQWHQFLWPSPLNTLYIILYILSGVLAFLTLNQAIAYAENVATVMVFDYLRIYYMLVANYILYQDTISIMGFVGVLLISFGASYTVFREAKLRHTNKLKLPRAPRYFR